MSLSTQPLVSVVTPLHNVEEYLAECIESVLSQNYQNLEYIIVNNCSTDKSLQIAEQHARQDPRIQIHTNAEFLQMIQNWNHSLHYISPESRYCKIVHGDDWLFPDCITRMVELAEAHPSVGMVSSYRLEENRVTLAGLPYSTNIIDGREICRLYLLDDLFVFGSPTSTLIRSDIIRSREKFYNESNIHADLEACFDILQTVDFGFVHRVLTFTRRHNEANTAFTRRFSTYDIAALHLIKTYGKVYLTEKESESVNEKYLRRYYRQVVRKTSRLKKSNYLPKRIEFWRYHRKALKEIGYPLDLYRLLKFMFIDLYNRVISKVMINQV